MAKILIIEDEEILLDILHKKLKNKGYEVIIAKDGDLGLKAVEADRPDMILLDMVMPKKDGYEVLEELKQKNSKIPVMIISNSRQVVDLERAKELGACDYIVKAELNPDEIIEKISKCLMTIDEKKINTNIASDNTEKPLEPNEKDAGEKKTIILVAEDDPFLRELCSKKLERMGYNVVTAMDGVEAYEKIIKTKPTLVLLDVIMPGMEGFEVLKRVRGNIDTNLAKTPIVILSNLGQDDDKKKGIELGANDYLVKSDNTIDQIIKKIEHYL